MDILIPEIAFYLPLVILIPTAILLYSLIAILVAAQLSRFNNKPEEIIIPAIGWPVTICIYILALVLMGLCMTVYAIVYLIAKAIHPIYIYFGGK